jgi:hypothetical protein
MVTRRSALAVYKGHGPVGGIEAGPDLLFQLDGVEKARGVGHHYQQPKNEKAHGLTGSMQVDEKKRPICDSVVGKNSEK